MAYTNVFDLKMHSLNFEILCFMRIACIYMHIILIDDNKACSSLETFVIVTRCPPANEFISAVECKMQWISQQARILVLLRASLHQALIASAFVISVSVTGMFGAYGLQTCCPWNISPHAAKISSTLFIGCSPDKKEWALKERVSSQNLVCFPWISP